MRYLVPICLSAMLAVAALGDRRSLIISKKREELSTLDHQALIDFETGAAADKWRSNATPASLASAINFGGSFLSFTIVSNSAAIASNGLLSVNGTAGIVADGTRALQYDDNVTQNGYAALEFLTQYPIISIQLWLRYGTMWNGAAFQSFDTIDCRDTGGGEYLIFNCYDGGSSPGPLEFSIHTQGGTTLMNGGGTNATRYCVDMHWNSNTMGCLIRVRDTNGTLFCSGSNPLTSAQMLKRIRLGASDNHGSSHAGNPSVVIDRIKVNTNGTFPLGFP